MGEITLDGHDAAGGVVTLTSLQQSARDLEQELAWFGQLLETRFTLSFGQEAAYPDACAIPPSDLRASDSPYDLPGAQGRRRVDHPPRYPAGDSQGIGQGGERGMSRRAGHVPCSRRQFERSGAEEEMAPHAQASRG